MPGGGYDRRVTNDLRTKRVYAGYGPEDGYRVLVDRLWPRGVTKAAAAVDLWLPDLAPSPSLRRWFHQDPSQWTEFCRRYVAELSIGTERWRPLLDRLRGGRVTLLYSARDTRHNQAVALQTFLLQQIRMSERTRPSVGPSRRRVEKASPVDPRAGSVRERSNGGPGGGDPNRPGRRRTLSRSSRAGGALRVRRRSRRL